MAKENKSKYAILGMLSLSPMSGYDIKKNIEASISYFWNEGYGQIYPMLKQIVSEGLATVHAEESQGKPDRYVYTITDKGHEELQRWIIEPVEPARFRSELLLKLYFGSQVSTAANIRLVEETRANLVELLQTYKNIEQMLSEQVKQQPDTANPTYWLITLRYGQHFVQSYLTWCDETIATLKELAQAEKAKETPR